jgi:hypothetical protein
MAVVLPRRCFQLPVITYRERREEEEEIYRTHKKLQPGCFTLLRFKGRKYDLVGSPGGWQSKSRPSFLF